MRDLDSVVNVVDRAVKATGDVSRRVSFLKKVLLHFDSCVSAARRGWSAKTRVMTTVDFWVKDGHLSALVADWNRSDRYVYDFPSDVSIEGFDTLQAEIDAALDRYREEVAAIIERRIAAVEKQVEALVIPDFVYVAAGVKRGGISNAQ